LKNEYQKIEKFYAIAVLLDYFIFLIANCSQWMPNYNNGRVLTFKEVISKWQHKVFPKPVGSTANMYSIPGK